MRGGRLVGNNVTKLQCRDLCQADVSCLAVDYDSINRLCWTHTERTSCGQLRVQIGTAHYKKVPCKRGRSEINHEIGHTLVALYNLKFA